MEKGIIFTSPSKVVINNSKVHNIDTANTMFKRLSTRLRAFLFEVINIPPVDFKEFLCTSCGNIFTEKINIAHTKIICPKCNCYWLTGKKCNE